jgi:hypothetical protein
MTTIKDGSIEWQGNIAGCHAGIRRRRFVPQAAVNFLVTTSMKIRNGSYASRCQGEVRSGRRL